MILGDGDWSIKCNSWGFLAFGKDSQATGLWFDWTEEWQHNEDLVLRNWEN